jgi:hypothetical protein
MAFGSLLPVLARDQINKGSGTVASLLAMTRDSRRNC